MWPDTSVEESNLAYNVFALRKALGDTAENGQYIETVPKRGYRFIATVTRASRGNGASPSLEAVAGAPVPEAVSTGQEFHANGKPRQLPATSEVRRHFPSRPLRAAAWFAAGVICAGGVALLMVPRKAVPTPVFEPKSRRVFSCQRRRHSRCRLTASSWCSAELARMGSIVCGLANGRRSGAPLLAPRPNSRLTPHVLVPDSQFVAFAPPANLMIDVRVVRRGRCVTCRTAL